MIKTVSWPPPRGNLNNINAIKYNLQNIEKALNILENPQQNIPFPIHIAGTNGKGSTTAFLESILKAAGFKSNVYTSPSLIYLNERIKIENNVISDDNLLSLLEEIKAALIPYKLENSLSFFEGFTIAAFLAFKRSQADFSLIEAGLGGRLDATNVINSKVCILTSVSFDHTEILGKTIKEISLEKLAIQKSDTPFIISRQPSCEVYELAKNIKNTYVYEKDYKITFSNDAFIYESLNLKLCLPLPSLKGLHQVYNAATAIKACEVIAKQYNFNINENHVKKGLMETSWPARLEKITAGKIFRDYPHLTVYIDGAHNEDGIKAALAYFNSTQEDYPQNYIICGFLQRKNIQQIIPLFKNLKNIITVGIHSFEKSHTASELCEAFRKVNLLPVNYKESFIEALNNIKSRARVLILGSLYLAGEVLEYNNIL